MELDGPQEMTFHGLFGLVTQPLEHYNMENNSIMAISQSRQYHVDFMSRDFIIKEQGRNISHGDSKCHWIATYNDLYQE